MPSPRILAVLEELYIAFGTDESIRALSKRLNLRDSNIRECWIAKFGQALFDQRSVRVTALGRKLFGERSRGKPKKQKEVVVPCASCAAPVIVNLIQKAHFKRILCPACTQKESLVDRYCPVCGLGVIGAKGLAMHMTKPNAPDPGAHAAYLAAKAEARWEGKVENQEYVVCQLCGHRAESLARHLLAEHKVTAVQYKVLFPEALIRSAELKVARGNAIREGLKQFQQKAFC